MKTNFYARIVRLISTNLGNAMLAAFLILASSTAVLGQVSSYSDVGESGGTAIGYGATTGVYEAGWHVNYTYVVLTGPSGAQSYGSGFESATAYLPVTEDGYYSLSTNHEGTCPVTEMNHPIGGSNGGQQVCTDTCTPCLTSRDNHELLCWGALATCEGAAFTLYNNAIQTCDNANYCKPNHPDFNQGQCDQCKSTALENYVAGQGLCATTFGVCWATRPNCFDGIKKKGNCDICFNN